MPTVLSDDFLDEALVRFARGTRLQFARYVEAATLERAYPDTTRHFSVTCGKCGVQRSPNRSVVRPRTVILSDGTTVSGAYEPAYGEIIWRGAGYSGASCKTPLLWFTFARNSADARALADLVDHPTEEVPA